MQLLLQKLLKTRVGHLYIMSSKHVLVYPTIKHLIDKKQTLPLAERTYLNKTNRKT